MNIACSTDGNRVHNVSASMTSPASSHKTTCSPSSSNVGQCMAQAVVVNPMTSSGGKSVGV